MSQPSISELSYKKMAGTSAVFVSEHNEQASPVERDGMVWTASELGLGIKAVALNWKPMLDNSLVLEGLEDYDPPMQGDARYLSSQNLAFVYIEKVRAWIQITAC